MAKKSKKKGAKKTAKKSVRKSAKKPVKKAPAKKSAAKKSAAKTTRRPVKKAARKASQAATPAPRTTTISPYLTFNGNCEEAFNFYRSVFGGEFQYVGRFKDMPPSDGQQASEGDANKIMHISLPVSRETVLMGSDTSEQFGQVTEGNNFSISVSTTSDQEADRIYNGLAEGGKKTMPMNQTFWGSYFGMTTDRYGINWMVSHDKTPQK